MNTPWGKAQTRSRLAHGIVEVSTASHGGIHLSPTRNALVHEAWRDGSGWYEEDCLYNIVVISFPDLFAGQRIERLGCTVLENAHRVLKDHLPDQYGQVFGVNVTLAESEVLRERAFAASVVDKLVSNGAWGHGNDCFGQMRVPVGWVGVCARRGGRWASYDGDDRWFLVPADEYRDRGRYGIVIDTGRHPVWPEVEQEQRGQPVVVAPVLHQRREYRLVACARPHRGQEVGLLWRWSAVGDRPEEWTAYRKVGTPAGAPLVLATTPEEALRAAGFELPPYASTPTQNQSQIDLTHESV